MINDDGYLLDDAFITMTIDDESSWSMMNDHGEELLDDTFQCLMMLDEFMCDDNLAHDAENVILKIDPPVWATFQKKLWHSSILVG